MVQQMMPMDVQGNPGLADRKQIKHIGKLKDDNANVAIIFRTVPEEHDQCLVIGPKFLDDTNHNAFMKALESSEGQDSFELGTYLKQSSISRWNQYIGLLTFNKITLRKCQQKTS